MKEGVEMDTDNLTFTVDDIDINEALRQARAARAGTWTVEISHNGEEVCHYTINGWTKKGGFMDRSHGEVANGREPAMGIIADEILPAVREFATGFARAHDAEMEERALYERLRAKYEPAPGAQ